jgi:hypothetical protein
MSIAHNYSRALLGGVLLAVLSACGGGGSGSDSSGGGGTPPPAATYTLGGTITGLGATGLVLANGSETASPSSGATTFTLATQVATGATYSVVVQTQPSGEMCTVASGSGTVASQDVSVAVSCTATYTMGGTLSGLTAAGLVLTNGSQSASPAAGAASFSFSSPVASGSSYNITVQTQPTGENCTVASGSGTVGSQNVSVTVTCAPLTYPVNGTISGLTAGGLVLTDGAETVSPASGATSFSFPTAITVGTDYAVSVQTQPTGLVCVVENSAGVAGTSGPTIQVVCGSGYTLFGTVHGLPGPTATMLLSDGTYSTAPLWGSGAGLSTGDPTFSFPPRATGTPYTVSVQTQPDDYTCTVANGTGTIGTSNVTNIKVNCLKGRWASKATMPVPRGNSAVAVLNNQLYVIGGVTLPNNNQQTVCYNTVSIYDPSTDSWSSGAAYPITGYGMSAVVMNGEIYVFGGDDCNQNGASVSSVYAYDPSTRQWTHVSDMPVGPLVNTGASTDGSHAYVIGGINASTLNYSPKIQIYDPVANTWTESSVNLPFFAGAAVIYTPNSSGSGGGVLIYPGYFQANPTSTEYAYFPDSDQALNLGQLPYSSGWTTGAAIGSTAYVIAATSTNPVAFYNISTQLASPNVARTKGSAAVINGSFYLVGGILPTGYGPGSGALEVYLP